VFGSRVDLLTLYLPSAGYPCEADRILTPSPNKHTHTHTHAHTHAHARTHTHTNRSQFNPKERYSGWNYQDVVLRPMADAVNKAVM